MCASGIQGVETVDAVKHPPMYRTAPTTKSHSAPVVTSAKVEKPCSEPVIAAKGRSLTSRMTKAVMSPTAFSRLPMP